MSQAGGQPSVFWSILSEMTPSIYSNPTLRNQRSYYEEDEISFSCRAARRNKKCGRVHGSYGVLRDDGSSNVPMFRPRRLEYAEGPFQIFSGRNHRRQGFSLSHFLSLLHINRKVLGLGLPLMGGEAYCQGLMCGYNGEVTIVTFVVPSYYAPAAILSTMLR